MLNLVPIGIGMAKEMYLKRKSEAMKQKTKELTAIIEPEDDGDVAHCPELDLVSQGDTIEKAR